MGRIRPLATTAGWLGGLGAAAWSLIRLGHLPWLRLDWDDPQRWLTTTELEVVVAALARLAGLAIVGWIALSSLLYLLARVAGIRPRRLGWLSVGPIRRAVDAALAGSLLISSMVPGVATAATQTTNASDDTPAEAVDPAYVPLPAGRDAAHEPPNEAVGADQPPGEDVPDDSSDVTTVAAGTEIVVVESGDHLWGLAERRLETALGRSPTDTEVAPYWVRVVDANRAALRSGDPDLIYPGEEIVLPEINPGS